MQIERPRVKSCWAPTNTTTATTARTAAKNKTSKPQWRIISNSKRPPDCLKWIEPVQFFDRKPEIMMKIRIISLLLLLALGSAHAQLSATAQALLLDKKIISAIESGDHAAAAGLFAQRKEVDVAVPSAVQMEMAKVYYALGDYLAAHARLTDYLNAAAPDSPDYEAAQNMYIELEAKPEYLAYLAQKERARVAARVAAEQERLRPGRKFRDCDVCPKMVVVEAGSFMMGSPSSEEGRDDAEGPVHRVTIARPFAVGVHEVTFAEWDACVADGGCGGYSPSDQGWGRGRRPVSNVSWNDVQSYLGWLSAKTGERYRLLSESEWEYAARAGTTTPFHTGSTISTGQANYEGNYTYGSGARGKSWRKTLSVGEFPANKFGLRDVHGNVREWVQDCWNEDYQGAPNCSRRVLRGGSWRDHPKHLRSAYRYGDSPRNRDRHVGFRVARTFGRDA